MVPSKMCTLPMSCVLMQPIPSQMLASELCTYNKPDGLLFSPEDRASMIPKKNFKF